MAIDPHYIPAFSIEEVLLDRDTGAPLSGGKVYFEQDNQRGVLKPVYQITGTSPNYSYIQLPNPMTLSSIGTFEDSMQNPVVPYFFPYDSDFDVELYYVRVTSADDVPQFDREAVPYISSQETDEVLSVITNELSNPQFVEVNFDTSSGSYVYNFSGVTDEVVNIAPGWDIVVTSPAPGTVTVSQVAPSGSLNLPTNPATLLSIASTGLTKLWLRQRLYGSPNLWGSGYIAATFLAKTYNGTSVTLNMYYSQSDGTIVNQLLVAASLPASGAYAMYPGSKKILASTSTDTFPDAYVDIYFDIPLSIQIDISSVMVAYTGQTSIANIEYDQESEARQIDHLFNYYEVPLNFKPIPSFLVGWDFPLNPAQILGENVTMNTTAAYIWDQTICKSVVGNVAVVRDSVTGGFQATTANANEAFYQLQYLTQLATRKFLGTTLSVNISAFRTQAGGACTVKVYLCRGSSAATVPTLPTSLGTIDASGNFTLTAANWTVIPRSNLGQASGTLSVVNTGNYATLNDVEDLQFNGWEVTDATQISDTNKIAIVVTYSCPTTTTVVVVDSISVVPGDIPTRPAPQTRDEVLRECQHYYEKSYPLSDVAGTNTTRNQKLISMNSLTINGSNNSAAYATPFEVDYQWKRAEPVITIYTPAGVSGSVLASLNYLTPSVLTFTTATANAALATFWAAPVIWFNKTSYFPISGTSIASTTNASNSNQFSSASIAYQFVADARLGIVT